MKRLFLAIPVHERSREEIVKGVFTDEIVKKMPVRWTAVQNLHLTLQFLGDVEEKRISKIKEMIDRINMPVRNENLSFSQIGAFPNTNAPRIIWLGIKRNDYLLQIQHQLTGLLEEAGFNVDRKRYKPHLTLGRVRDNASVPSDAFDHLVMLGNDLRISDSPLDKVTLYESLLRPGGPIYTAMYEKWLNR